MQYDQARTLILEALKTGELTIDEITEILEEAGIKQAHTEAKTTAWSLCEQGLAKFTDRWTLQSIGEFVNTRVHLKELAKAFADNLTYLNDVGLGTWGLNPVRPFLRSGYGALCEILEICDIKPDGLGGDGERCYTAEQLDYADRLYGELLGDFLRKAIRSYCQR